MTDIILTPCNDLSVFDGDFQTGESTSQEVENIIISYPGYWKQYPQIGCSAPSYVASPGNGENLMSAIETQLKSDGKIVQSYSYTMTPDGELTINVNGIAVTL